MAVLSRAALLLLVLLATGGCRGGAEQWGPFRGQVVDAETGQPISGAHVMVAWERDNPNPVHWTQSFHDAHETVTDASGRFEIPRERRLPSILVRGPRFAAFAPGYVAEAEDVTPPGGRPYVDATILRMRRLGTLEERCQHIPGSPGIAAGRKVPLFVTAVQEYVTGLNCRWPVGEQR
jgi:hypothetical protein